MLFSHPILSILVLGGVSIAVPTPPAPKYKSQAIAANFENDRDIIPVVALAPVGMYASLYYNGFNGDSRIINPAAGIKAQSPTNIVGFGFPVPATIQEGQPALTAAYQDTTIEFFDLESFYFGLEADLKNALGDLPTAGTLTIECIAPSGKSVKKQDFRFETNGGLVQDEVQVKPIGFKGCQKVTFNSKADNALLQPTLATITDTYRYTVYSKNPLGAV